jgi:uncharacterized OsmC-like protein
MLEYDLTARWRGETGSTATTHEATVEIDTAIAGKRTALNPAELLLAAVAACMIKGVERAAPLLKFGFTSLTISLHATRQDAPPRMTSITYRMMIGTEESDRRLKLLHTNVRKYGTISNTIADAVELSGTIERAPVAS